MKPFLALIALVLVVSGCTGAGPSTAVTAAPTAAADGTLVDIGVGLEGPSGLAATVYASGLKNVAAAAFDADDRLWVATADYSDSGADGLYLVASERSTPVEVVAGLHTPLGLLWHEGSLYVSSSTGVTAYAGFDGARFAETRTVLALPAGLGEVNGLALSPDGRMWLGISASCDHCSPTVADSASVVSFLPDGTDVRVEATGIRAAVGLEFYPGTSDLFVTMNQRDDLAAATPGDWLSIVASGQAWGFPDCYGQGGVACAGAPSPVAVLDAHAAVSGVAIVMGQLGGAIGTSAIVAEWSLGKVQQVALATSLAAGGKTTYTGTVRPFLTGIANPVAVVLGPDGALYIGDWTSGVVYRIAVAST